MQRLSTSSEAGMTISRTFGAIFFPRRMLAAAAKSVKRPPVQVPMKHWLTGMPASCEIGCTLSTLDGAETCGSSSSMSNT